MHINVYIYIKFLINSSTYQLVNLSTYQLINSSTCQLVNSSTRKLPQYSSFFKFGFAVRSVDGIG